MNNKAHKKPLKDCRLCLHGKDLHVHGLVYCTLRDREGVTYFAHAENCPFFRSIEEVVENE